MTHPNLYKKKKIKNKRKKGKKGFGGYFLLIKNK